MEAVAQLRHSKDWVYESISAGIEKEATLTRALDNCMWRAGTYPRVCDQDSPAQGGQGRRTQLLSPRLSSVLNPSRS